jgi:hypothetical protein
MNIKSMNLTQRRKGAKKIERKGALITRGISLCAFAPLRETSFSAAGANHA